MPDAALLIPEGLTPIAKIERERYIASLHRHLQEVAELPLSILIWGAGPASKSEAFQKRDQIRRRLLELGHNAMFSEELGEYKGFSQKVIEFAQAKEADLVIILLEDSPGAIGEAHDFIAFPELIQKIFVLVPFRYKTSYSGMGTIRLLEESNGGVYWYSEEELRSCCVTSNAVKRAQSRRELKYMLKKQLESYR